MKTLLPNIIRATLLIASITGYATAETKKPSELNDLEMAHVAYTADNIDIRYAHLALAISDNPSIHDFANAMIRDHNAVNEQALALLKKLNASPQDNFLSKQLTSQSIDLINKMKNLTGNDFDRFYANNELQYHKAVNNLVENAFIPNIENAEVKALFKAGLGVFKGHQTHAEIIVSNLNKN